MANEKSCLVEIDTDGILVDYEFDDKEVNAYISSLIQKTTGIKECTLEMEKEKFERGFIHAMKNYLLLEKQKDGSLEPIIHGAYFKSSKASKVYDDAVENVIAYALFDKLTAEEARKKSLDICLRPIEDFIMHIKMSKNVEEYSSTDTEFYDSADTEEFSPVTNEEIYTESEDSLSSAQVIGIAKQYRSITGVLPEKGTILKYFICKDPLTGIKKYEYFNEKDTTCKNRLYLEEYEKLIKKLFDSTKIATYEEIGLEADWLSDLL